MSTGLRHPFANPWFMVDDTGEDAVLISVAGGVAADRSTDLWAGLEGALEQADGRLVVTDLTKATAFDVDTLEALIRVARASRRRHLDICALMRPNSPIEQYARCCGLSRILPTYESLSEALASTDREPPFVGRQSERPFSVAAFWMND